MRTSLRLFIRLVLTVYIVESVAGMMLHGDHIEVLGLQTNVTFLKSQSESQSLEFRKSTRAPLKLITRISCIMHSLMVVLSVSEERALILIVL